MDVHYLSPSEEDLHRAIGIYTAWFDAQMQGVAHSVAQETKKVSQNRLTYWNHWRARRDLNPRHMDS